MKKIFKKIQRQLKRATKIAIFCHVDPDFDCLSSMYGLGLALKSIGKEVSMFTHESFSENQKLLLDESLVQIGGFEAENYDLLISVDTPTTKRLGIYGEAFKKHSNTIKIDHHIDEEPDMAKLKLIDTRSSSCAELVLEILTKLKFNITKKIATILFSGLSADTNSYTTTNVTKNTYKNGMALCDLGADTTSVNNALTRSNSLKRLELRKVFYKNIEIYSKQIAISTLSYREFKRAKAEKRDSDGFSNELISYIGINIACFITENAPHQFGLSFRSMKGYDVTKIVEVYGGGGHKEAAGAKIFDKNKDIEQIKAIVLKEIRKYLKARVENGTKKA